ncbi:corA-like Mg2+ transporter protein [Hirsutella rhossiliensis]|uniref:CorA-like mg2+ transporter protein n=1 Tax=Hirsutella rhossiliensis TaxID=111463 RepID=A0A9P8N1R3_9HYPO|nr:corA-like mg2+ transporter protein [Hirsutella rhossiliensis]KAH0966043.1 corA-like mg2+ transporter protein [Hirsutella rhossiliensis]
MNLAITPRQTAKNRVTTLGANSSNRATLLAAPSSRVRKAKPAKSLKPDEYAKAVEGYAALPNGAGQNYIALAKFLAEELRSIDYHLTPSSSRDDFVVLYPLDVEDDHHPSLGAASSLPTPQHKPSDSDPDPDSADDRSRRHVPRKPMTFSEPNGFFSITERQNGEPQSCIVFMRGFMSAAWINSVGARYVVDPEFFCRHLDFRPPDDNSNNFSIPALPSSSWYLIELPVMTIGTRMAARGPLRLDRLADLRRQGVEALTDHRYEISKLSSTKMTVGESMVRNFYVFDEMHFAVEQRISICMQPANNGKTFSLIVWLDSGAPIPSRPSVPWSVRQHESYYLPVILHRHMVALKFHLFASADSGDDAHARSASSLPADYGRSLRPSIMARDALYSLTEVFDFAASSQMEFLNLIDVKLDKYTSLPAEEDFQILPNLTYMKQTLYQYIQKTQRTLDSIRSAQQGKWPTEQTDSGSRKAKSVAQNLEQDFQHLLNRADRLHRRSTEAITVLMSSLSISKSQMAIVQAQRVGKLTFLAFIFVPLSFTTSFFGMNVAELADNTTGLKTWGVLSASLTVAIIALFFMDVVGYARRIWAACKELWVRMSQWTI